MKKLIVTAYGNGSEAPAGAEGSLTLLTNVLESHQAEGVARRASDRRFAVVKISNVEFVLEVEDREGSDRPGG